MEVIEGGFGKDLTKEVREAMKLSQVLDLILEEMGLTETMVSDTDNITIIINAGDKFACTSSKPNIEFILSELTKAQYIVTDLSLGEGL